MYREHRSPIRLIHEETRKRLGSRDMGKASLNGRGIGDNPEMSLVVNGSGEYGRGNHLMAERVREEQWRGKGNEGMGTSKQKGFINQDSSEQSSEVLSRTLPKVQEPPYPAITLHFDQNGSPKDDNGPKKYTLD